MRWIVQVAEPSLDVDRVSQGLKSDHDGGDSGRKAPVLVTRDSSRDIISSLATSLERATSWSTSASQLPIAPAVATVITAGKFHLATLPSEAYTMRRVASTQLAILEGALGGAQIEQRTLAGRSLIVAMAVNSYSTPDDMQRCKALAPLLAQAAVPFDSPLPTDGPVAAGRDTALSAPYRPRKRPTDDHIEIRSIAEFDAVLRELQRSKAFNSARDRVTLCVNVTVFCTPPDISADVASGAPVRPTIVSSATHWHVCDSHHDPIAHFLRAGAAAVPHGADAMIDEAGRGFVPLEAPAQLLAGHIVLTDASDSFKASRLMANIDHAAAAYFGRLPPQSAAPAETGTANGRPSSPKASSSRRTLEAGNPVDLGVSTDVEALRSHQNEKVRLVRSIADADAHLEHLSARLDGVERLELAMRESENLSAEHDEAEATFSMLIGRTKAEKAEQSRLQSELTAARRRLADFEAEARSVAAKKASVVGQVEGARRSLAEERALLAKDEERLRETEEAAAHQRGLAESRARDERIATEQEIEHLTAARAAAIDEASEGLLHSRSEAEASRRARLERLEAELDRQRRRTETALEERRAGQAAVIELQTKLSQISEAARADERNAKLSQAQLDQHRRRWGDDILVARLHAIEQECAKVATDVIQLTASRDSVRIRVEEARASKHAADTDLAVTKARVTRLEEEVASYSDSFSRRAVAAIAREEADFRAALEFEFDAAVDQLRVAERLGWMGAIRLTEASMHAVGHSETRRDIAESAARVNGAHERILGFKNRLEISLERIDKARSEHSDIVAEYHRQHDTLMEEERRAEALRAANESRGENAEDEATLELQQATDQARKRANRIRVALSRAPVDPLTSVRPVVLPSLREVHRRLVRLHRDAKRRARDSDVEGMNSERALRRVLREVDERSEIRSRVRHAVSRYQARAEELEGMLYRAEDDAATRRQRDGMLREQLKMELVNAQETTARHKREDGERLREAYEAIDELRANVQQSTSQVQQLRVELATASRRNTQSNAETLQLEIRHETLRAQQLQEILARAVGDSAMGRHASMSDGTGPRAPSAGHDDDEERSVRGEPTPSAISQISAADSVATI